MRKIVVFMMVSLDGVMQAPGGPEEDDSGGFEYGGWTAPYGDESFGDILKKELSVPFDLLLGRKTYDIWAAFWPQHADVWPGGGSGNLLQTLIKLDLVDVFWLMIYPITLGAGKRLFADGTIPAAFKVTESIVGSNGVIVVNYERAGAITTGS